MRRCSGYLVMHFLLHCIWSKNTTINLMSIASRNCCLATIRYSAIASRKRKSGSRKFTPLKSKVCASSSTRKHPTSKLSLLRRKLLQHLRNLILRLYLNKHSHRPSTDNWIMRIFQKKIYGFSYSFLWNYIFVVCSLKCSGDRIRKGELIIPHRRCALTRRLWALNLGKKWRNRETKSTYFRTWRRNDEVW